MSVIRSAVPGVIAPGDTVTVDLAAPPMIGAETPVVLCQDPGALAIVSITPESVTIRNSAEHSVPYVVVVVAKRLLQLAHIPWQQLLADLNTSLGRSRLLEKFTQVLLDPKRLEDKT